jgi:orotidine-5'-phosphate decarboxylase
MDDERTAPSAAIASHVADRLILLMEQRAAPVCVGLDPVLERLPDALKPRDASLAAGADAVRRFSEGVIDAVASIVPCVKVQSACFERFGHAGVLALEKVVGAAGRAGLAVIVDAKRGDIGISAAHYAAAMTQPYLNAGERPPDWITVHSYLGKDGIAPFLASGHGAFALVRTSNPTGDAIQSLELKSGGTVAEAVAQEIARTGCTKVGRDGYSSLGAVIGATRCEDAKKLRELMPQQIFLVPGFGAQGAGVNDVLPCFKADGRGAIITASRSVLYAQNPKDPAWQQAITDAAWNFAEQIGRAVGMR